MALDENLTAEEQAQFDAMRPAPEPEASPVEEAATPEPAQPAEGATTEAPAQVEAGEKKEKVKTVEFGAFHEERERRKDVEKQLQEERRRFNLAWEKLNAPTQPQQPAAPEIPDFAADPAGHILGTMRQTGLSVEQLAQAMQQQQQQASQREAANNLQQIGRMAEQRYRSENPDYDNAINHMITTRDTQLRHLGVNDPLRRNAIIQQEALHIVQTHGEEAPQVAYELAKTYGYAPKSADPVPAVTAAEATDATEKLERVQAGQQQARSLGAARGGSPSGIPPAERISKMSPAEFDAFMSKAEKDGTLRDFMGA